MPLGLIAAPHCYAYDVAVAVPLLATVASPRTIPGILAVVALSPVPYLLMAADHSTSAGAAIIVVAVLAGTFKFGAWDDL